MPRLNTYHEYWIRGEEDDKLRVLEFIATFKDVFRDEHSELPKYPEDAQLCDLIRISDEIRESMKRVLDEIAESQR